MKQFACWFSHGVGNGAELRRSVHAAQTPAEILERVEGFFLQQAAADSAALDTETLGATAGIKDVRIGQTAQL